MATLAEAPQSPDTAPANAPRHWSELRLTDADLAHIPGEAGWPVVGNTFTMLANIIAAPFNGFLAEKVEVVVRGTDDFPPFSWAELVAMVPRTLAREMRKLGYFLPRAIGLFILSFIPVVNLIAAPLWLLFGVWMMAIQYIDYPADNHKLGWNEMLAWLRQKRWQSMSFGGSVYLVLLVPVVNLLMMPAAVAGATLFWVRERGAENLVARQR